MLHWPKHTKRLENISENSRKFGLFRAISGNFELLFVVHYKFKKIWKKFSYWNAHNSYRKSWSLLVGSEKIRHFLWIVTPKKWFICYSNLKTAYDARNDPNIVPEVHENCLNIDWGWSLEYVRWNEFRYFSGQKYPRKLPRSAPGECIINMTNYWYGC